MIRIEPVCTSHTFKLRAYSTVILESASRSLALKAQNWLEEKDIRAANIQISQSVCPITGYGGGTIEIIVSTSAFITYDTTQAGPND